MARRIYKRLTAAQVKKLATQPGMHPDGDGLYLQVHEGGVASWILRFLSGGRERYMGLGPLRRVSLAEARRLADAARQLRHDGVDPIEARRAKQLDYRLKAAKAMSFKQCARAYITAHAAGWRNPVHTRQWPASLEKHVFPVFGDLPVAAIDTALVVKALEPIWAAKTETASRVRGRIESVLDWAATAGHRPAGDNPARWKGHLENLLANPLAAKRAARQAALAAGSPNARGEHHAALPYGEIGTFLVELQQQEGVAARALEFAILTAGRSGEVIGARWSEIDLAERVWTIPATRMKGSKEHRVPLSDAALAIIEQMVALRSSDFVFPGLVAGRPLGRMALLDLLRRTGRGCKTWGDLTVHGFRSTFRDWAAERTSFPAEIAEMALAHNVGTAVQRAYQRSDLFEKRRQLAAAWASYCAQPAAAAARGQVVPIGAR